MLQAISAHDDLLAFSGRSPFLRWDVPAPLTTPAYRCGEAFAVPRETRTRSHGLLVMGPPGDVEPLLAALVDSGRLPDPLARVTVQRGSLDAVARHLPLGGGNDWDWLCATQAPSEVSAEHRVAPLGPEDEPSIRALLEEGNPRTDAHPFEYPGQRWVGVRSFDGTLVACGVREPNAAGHPLLAGITVHPAERGTGLGLAVTARLTREAVDEAGVCTLGMYADNDVARRVYTRLGYGDTHSWSSRRIATA